MELLNTNPNTPAPTGVLLLFRTEVQSEFKALRSDFGQQLERMDRFGRSLESVAQELVRLDQRVTRHESRLEALEGRMERVENRLMALEAKTDLILEQLGLILKKLA